MARHSFDQIQIARRRHSRDLREHRREQLFSVRAELTCGAQAVETFTVVLVRRHSEARCRRGDATADPADELHQLLRILSYLLLKILRLVEALRLILPRVVHDVQCLLLFAISNFDLFRLMLTELVEVVVLLKLMLSLFINLLQK